MFLRALEYIFLPMVAVLITFSVRAILSSKRMDGKEIIIELGYDVIVMCVFGLLLNSIGDYSHHLDDKNFFPYTILGIVMSFTCLCGVFIIVIIDMQILNVISDPELKLKKKYQCMIGCGISYIFLLTSVVMYGSYMEEIYGAIVKHN